MAHWLLRNGALQIVDDKKVSHFYSLILVILYFFVLSGIALFLLDQSGFTVVKVVSFSSINLVTNIVTFQQPGVT